MHIVSPHKKGAKKRKRLFYRDCKRVEHFVWHITFIRRNQEVMLKLLRFMYPKAKFRIEKRVFVNCYMYGKFLSDKQLKEVDAIVDIFNLKDFEMRP